MSFCPFSFCVFGTFYGKIRYGKIRTERSGQVPLLGLCALPIYNTEKEKIHVQTSTYRVSRGSHAGSLAACGDSTKPPVNETTNPAAATTSAPETEPAGPVPELPEVRYEGTELVFVNRPADAQYYNERWLYTEDITGDLINDSIYTRNTYIEEKYGVTITTIENSNPSGQVALASQSNDDLYDVCMTPSTTPVPQPSPVSCTTSLTLAM